MQKKSLKYDTANCSNDILKTLLYFDIFKYPLSIDEITQFSFFSKEKIKSALTKLVSDNIIYQHDGFYSLNKGLNSIKKRIKGNKQANIVLEKAKKTASFISQFPFVEGVFISGSLSKGYFGDDDDVDYFIITSANRLWIARTLLILYKKIFLLNSKKYFCVNYFISLNTLSIPEKNRFTATEFATLIPMNGNGVYNKLQDYNKWVLNYFPNYNQNKKSKPIKPNFFKRLLEFSLNGSIGNLLENKFMTVTKNHQKAKFKKLIKADFDIAFKGDKNISKHHPDNHQVKVIKELNKRIVMFNKKHQLSIAIEE